jgi:hypothetical protein
MNDLLYDLKVSMPWRCSNGFSRVRLLQHTNCIANNFLLCYIQLQDGHADDLDDIDLETNDRAKESEVELIEATPQDTFI